MTKIPIVLTLVLATPAAALANDGVCQLLDGTGALTNCQATAPPAITAPANMGQYCSITYPASGGGFFTWNNDLTGDPCAGLLGPGGSIKHAGMFSVTGTNVVFERCTDGHVNKAQGVGGAPLLELYNDAAKNQRPACDFLVSPQDFPIFNSPFDFSDDSIEFSHGTGFDHALPPGGQTFDMRDEFNEPGARAQVFIMDQDGQQKDGTLKTNLSLSSTPTLGSLSVLPVNSTAGFPAHHGSLEVAIVTGGELTVEYDHLSTSPVGFVGLTHTDGTALLPTEKALTVTDNGIVVQASGFIDDHQGIDFNLKEGTPILAVTEGVIDMIRRRDYPACTGGDSGDTHQGEIYVRHRVSGGNARYDEVYESYYAHWKIAGINPRTGVAWQAGDIVHRGETLAFVNETGCATGFHLHLGVFRLTNTASQYNYPLVILTAPNHDSSGPGSDLAYRNAIDPSGFAPPTATAFDPWAWKAFSPFDTTVLCDNSTIANSLCDRGAPSPNLWRSNQEPPRGDW